MNRGLLALLCLAYIIGLLIASAVSAPGQVVTWQQWAIPALGVGCLSVATAVIAPRIWRKGPGWRGWIATGLVTVAAMGHFQLRLPQPSTNDISRVIPASEVSRPASVQGRVLNVPRLNRSNQTRFWLQANQLDQRQSVTGKLYVTTPQQQAKGLTPGQIVTVAGNLYRPQSAANPGAFDFSAYLARQGAFAGLSAWQVTWDEDADKPWGGWQLRQRIIHAQGRWLGSPAGQLLSSMVLGRRAVDLPFDIQDRFIQAGLAHVLAASGFHVSLVLGGVLVLTRRLSERSRLILGLGTLGVYISLTGLQPSILRASIMGAGALLALVTNRKVNPLGALLVTATLLLLCNPLWILDLGFQLSFLATLGLIVTVPALSPYLDWLPSAIAIIVAIPLAVFPWVFPLQLYTFGVFAPYSVAVNIITVPLIITISLGGMVSALAALIVPWMGSALAWLLYYPVQLLIAIVEFFTSLPGSSLAAGKIPLVELGMLYGLIGIVCLCRKWQRRWGVVSFCAIALVGSPWFQSHWQALQVTVLAANQEQVVVIQERDRVALIDSGKADTVRFTVLPFLQRQGINRIDLAIALDSSPQGLEGWSEILQSLGIERLLLASEQSQVADAPVMTIPPERLVAGEEIVLKDGRLELIQSDPPILQFQWQDQQWLLLTPQAGKQGQPFKVDSAKTRILVWPGGGLSWDWLLAWRPQVAIASSTRTLNFEAQRQLHRQQAQIYWTGRDGAIQWTPQQGFQTTRFPDADAVLE